MKPKILDCTLRDGGYVNNWNFGEDNIRSIVQKLIDAKIDIIECGFLNSKKFDNNFSLFNSREKISSLLEPYKSCAEFVLMLDIKDIDEGLQNEFINKKSDFWGIRLSFRPKEVKEALGVAEQLVKNGYSIFFQPMLTDSYTDDEFISLINLINELSPYAFYIVDTFGSMYQDDLLKKFSLLDKYLKNKVKIGFHSHNNLQLSFSNALALLNIETKREIIIDSSVFGMGRGAGNLSTEVVAEYLNRNFKTNYDISWLSSIYKENIASIYSKHPWGYSMLYFLSAMNNCHPNYATYLLAQNRVNQGMLNAETIANIFKFIPDDKKAVYDEELIKNLYGNLQ